MSITIAIPARYGSTRFPGKPLTRIAGKTMLARVVEVAQKAAQGLDDINVIVTTEDQRIADHAAELGVPCYITDDTCRTGSDRVRAALAQMSDKPTHVVNLQGDAPFTPVSVVRAMIDKLRGQPEIEVLTPVQRLSWVDLDRLRENKKTTPFSGTTAIIGQNGNQKGRAIWFSKNIIPAIRKEATLREEDEDSPIHQHMGLYGYRTDILERFCELPEGHYEALEGLEQLRLIENNIPITVIEVDQGLGPLQAGIDTPEDVARAEALLKDTGA